jgi:hypothetical protein
MKSTITLAAGLIIASTFAFAQTATKPASDDANTAAVATPDTKNANAPVAGANSFTEAQARKRISDAGFTGVTGLIQDSKGVWRGKAMKSGASTEVALDFQGNVTAN